MQQNPNAGAAGATARWRQPRTWAGLASVAALTLVLGACGSSDGDSDTGSASTSAAASTTGASTTAEPSGVAEAKAALDQWMATPTSIGITEKLQGKPKPGKSVVFLGTNDPNNVKTQKRVQQLTQEVGWDYALVGYDPAKPETFQSAINTALSKKADYLIESGLPLTPNQIRMVKDAGAKWVLNSVAPVEVKDPIIVNTDGPAQNGLMGRMLADWFVADSEGKGNAIMEHVPSYPILTAFTDSFQKEVEAKCPDCKLKRVDVTLPQLAAGKVPSLMVSELRKNPDAGYLVFDVGPFAQGVTSALKAAGLDDKVKIIGEAGDEAAIAGLQDGSQAAWTGFDASYQAYLDMDAMFRDAEGSEIPVDKLELMPTQLLTPENVGDEPVWSEPKDAEAQFKALWNLG